MNRPRDALIAGGALLTAVAVAALVLWPDEEMGNDSASRDVPPPPPAQKVAQFPPPVALIHPAGRRNDDPVVAAFVGESPALCDGCLTERAVLDVVEAYLRHLDPAYLDGDIRALPLADIAPETPGNVDFQPPLPPGLVDAPEFNPMGMSIDTRRYPVETTWIVWVQEGWIRPRIIETQVLNGTLPEVALSWPPIKSEVFVAVDGRTGEIWPDGIFHGTTMGIQPPHPPHYESVLDATRARAAQWLRGGGSELGSS